MANFSIFDNCTVYLLQSGRKIGGMGETKVDPRLVPDRERPGSWYVRIQGTDQSYIDPYDPMYLEFDYVQRIAATINSVFEPGGRITAIHVGGGGMTIPRYIAYTRPTSGQIVFEPDATLTQAVRDVAPLPKNSGIKVRATDGRTGMAQIHDDYADLVVVDAFSGACVPPELSTTEWFGEVRRVLHPDGIMAMNITDNGSLEYARRVSAAVREHFSPVVLGSDPATWKGRRFGNMVISAGTRVDPDLLVREAARGVFPHRVMYGLELDRWIGDSRPFTGDDSQSSVPPPGFLTYFF